MLTIGAMELNMISIAYQIRFLPMPTYIQTNALIQMEEGKYEVQKLQRKKCFGV